MYPHKYPYEPRPFATLSTSSSTTTTAAMTLQTMNKDILFKIFSHLSPDDLARLAISSPTFGSRSLVALELLPDLTQFERTITTHVSAVEVVACQMLRRLPDFDQVYIARFESGGTRGNTWTHLYQIYIELSRSYISNPESYTTDFHLRHR